MPSAPRWSVVFSACMATALSEAKPRPKAKPARLSPLEVRLLAKKHAALPELVRVLSAGRPADQLDAASMMGWIRSAESVEPLKTAIVGTVSAEIRQQAAFALSTVLLADGEDPDPEVRDKLATAHLERILAGISTYQASRKTAAACIGARGFVVHPSHVAPGYAVKVARPAKDPAEAGDPASFHASASEGDFYGAISGGGECGVLFLPFRSIGDVARPAAVVVPPGAEPLPLVWVSLFRRDGDRWVALGDFFHRTNTSVACGASLCPSIGKDYRRSGLWDPVKLALTENALGRLWASPPVSITPALFRLEAEPNPHLERGDAALIGTFAGYDSPVVQAAMDFHLMDWTSKPPRPAPLLKILGMPASDYLRLAVLGPVAGSGDVPIPLSVQIIGSASGPELRSAALKAYGSAVVRELREASNLPADEAAAKFGKLQGPSRATLLWDTSESLAGKDSKEACYAALTLIARTGLKQYGEHGRNKENSEVEACLPPSAKPQEVVEVLFWGDFASIETHNRFANDIHDKGGKFVFGQVQRHWYLLGASGWMH